MSDCPFCSPPQKRQVELIEETIAMTKAGYADSLKELERISEEIHQRRRDQEEQLRRLGRRGQGVGAEAVGEGANEPCIVPIYSRVCSGIGYWLEICTFLFHLLFGCTSRLKKDACLGCA